MYLRVCSTPLYPFDRSTQQKTVLAPIHPPFEFTEHASHIPVVVSFDATTTVRACAQALCEWHHPSVEADSPGPIPDTILITELSGAQWLADPFTLLTHTPIRSGSCLTPIANAVHLNQFVRASQPAAELIVFGGQRSPQIFTLVEGDNTIGRDRENRVIITDPSVSRVHATIRVSQGKFTVQDHHSHNGTQVNLRKARINHKHPIGSHATPARISFGRVAAEIRTHTSPGHAHDPSKKSLNSPESITLGSPKLEPPVTDEDLCLQFPSLPAPAPPHKFPVLSILAPTLIGTILFFVTHSALSLVGIAFSPIIALSSWLEQRWSRRKQSRIDHATHAHVLERITQRVATLHSRIRANLAQTYPPLVSRVPYTGTTSAPQKTNETWIRCGIAHSPSGITFTGTSHEQLDTEESDRVKQIRQKSQWVDHAVVAHDIAGSFLLIQGNPKEQFGVMRAALLHACLSTPMNNTLVQVFIPSTDAAAGAEWGWAAWLPYSLGSAAPQGALSTHPSEAETTEIFSTLVGASRDSVPAKGIFPTVYLVLVDAPEHLLHHAAAFLASPPGKFCTIISNLALPDSTSAPRNIICDITHATRTIVAQGVSDGRTLGRSRETMTFTEFDSCSRAEALALTRTFLQHATRSTPQDQIIGEAALPDSLPITHLAPLSEIRSVSHQEIVWQRSHSISNKWSDQHPAPPFTLNAAIGATAHGQLQLDLRQDGPHAFVIGTTGSGKSVFLQTWIFSMAAAHSPDRLTFFLLDFKGGAAFQPCANLPHISGFVTDLTPHLAERAQIALKAEVHRRETLLFEKSAADIAALEASNTRDAPPNLVVVIDECAVLFREHPPFRDTLQDISQRGRSLGIHLILSSQRSVGVIPDAIRSNLTVRVAMRLADPAESIDVLGTPEAAQISQKHPGRGYIRLGADPPIAFQTGCALECTPSPTTPSITVHPLLHVRPGIGQLSARKQTPHDGLHAAPDGVLRRLPPNPIIQHMHDATRAQKIARPRALWCRPLPQLITRQSAYQNHQLSDSEATIGIRDEPHFQRQSPETINPLALGNVLVSGTTASGKTTTAVTLVSEVLRCAPATWVYILQPPPTHWNQTPPHSAPNDHPIHNPPYCLSQIGQHIDSTDKDHLRRFLNTLSHVMQHPSQNAYRPHILVVIDDLETLSDTTAETRSDSDMGLAFTALLRHAPQQNCSIIATARSFAVVPRVWAGLFRTQILHRMPTDNDSHYVQGRNLPKRIVELPEGRALMPDQTGNRWNEVQIFQPEPLTLTDTNRRVWPPTPKVPRLPQRFTREAWEKQDPGGGWFALNTASFEPCAAPRNGLCVITGPARSGRSLALSTLREAAIDRLRSQGHAYVTLRVHNHPCDPHTPAGDWSLNTSDWGEALAYLSALPDTTHRIIVCNVHTIAQANSAEQPNQAHLSRGSSPSLLTHCSAVNALTLCEVPHRVAAQHWNLLSELRDANWILALQPDSSDLPNVLTTTVPRCQRGDFAAGSGYIVQPGNLTRVQVALPIDTAHASPPPVNVR